MILRTPVDLPIAELAARVARMPGPALLESGAGFAAQGRWSILAARPRGSFVIQGDRWTWSVDAGPRASGPAAEALAALARLLRRLDLAQPGTYSESKDEPFQGGMIGTLSYDLAPRLERVPRRHPAPSEACELHFGLYDTFVAVDHVAARAELWAVDLLGESRGAVAARRESFLDQLTRPLQPRPRARLEGAATSSFTRAEYLRAVERVRDYIRAGDVFQVNLSQRFEAHARRIDPFGLYERLKAVAPAPFAAYVRLGPQAVLSASPERFYATGGRSIVTQPIKGTRPRSDDPARDAALVRELAMSAKDRAELTMIIDVERNDLGRVCEYGSVRVVEPYAVESFAQVHHLVATVEGRLRDDVGPVDVVRAMFPGGSITGAPKIRAMEIIDELEKNRRSVYTGAIGYFSRGGGSAFNIAIRTMLVDGNRVTYQVGGGIVADSDPAAEYEETLHKGRGMASVLSDA